MRRDQVQIIVNISCLVSLERYWAIEHDYSYSIHVTFKQNDYRNKNKKEWPARVNVHKELFVWGEAHVEQSFFLCQIWAALYSAFCHFFSCDSSSIPDNVGPSVGLSVGPSVTSLKVKLHSIIPMHCIIQMHRIQMHRIKIIEYRFIEYKCIKYKYA